MRAGIPPLLAPPFRFEMGLRRGDENFFRNQDEPGLLAERSYWLDAEAARHAAALPGSDALLADAADFARKLNLEIPRFDYASTTDVATALGRAWEPDFLLLQADDTGMLTLRAACVCFPTQWSLTEKMSRGVTAIHAAAPTLNSTLSAKIDSFLAGLRPGAVSERWNWGLAPTAERNAHPARQLPRLSSGATLDRTWLRFEHQAFTRLAGGVLFGIRIGFERLDGLCTVRAEQLAELLASMPSEIATYKGVADARATIVAQLRAAAGGETPCPDHARL